jgi:hypothetical protein
MSAATKLKYEQFKALYETACAQGIEAGNNAIPTERVDGGACGFAWVNVRPGNCSFAKWLVAKGLTRRSYYGRVKIWISDHGQSWERKVAHADAMAKAFRDAGINAYSGSCLD